MANYKMRIDDLINNLNRMKANGCRVIEFYALGSGGWNDSIDFEEFDEGIKSASMIFRT